MRRREPLRSQVHGGTSRRVSPYFTKRISRYVGMGH